ncbi:MAG: hypothetical protein J6U60_02930, partial [Clostridia bacterium]|nr:hypothetical protein [Clostridia bacterium]
MNKKHTFKKTAALLLALGLTLGATGCNFLVTDSMKDLQQVVATVDVSATLAKDEAYKDYADDISALISAGALSTDIPKRDLVAYFLNVGYNYVQSYGYTYEDTFNLLMDGLTDRKILTQYAVAYYLKNEPTDSLGLDTFRANELAKLDDKNADEKKEKALLEAYPEVLTMKYFLTSYGKTDAESMKPYYKALYGLKKSLNDSLDSGESGFIVASSDTHTHEESRTTPTGVNTEKEDYLPMKDGVLDYDVYTGRNTLTDCGKYEKVDGSTSTTRKKAYSTFLSNLQGYGLIKEGENVANVTLLDYYYLELSSTLGQALVDKYYKDLQDKTIAEMTAADVQVKYDELKKGQESIYSENPSEFDTALDSVGDDYFLLYGVQDYGFVYNILLPFSTEQQQAYSAAKNKGLTLDGQYKARKALLTDIVAKDLRGAWFCEETDGASNYSFEGTGFANSYLKANQTAKSYLFFDDSLNNNEQYEKIKLYAGQYPYNGEIKLDEKGKFEKAVPDTSMKIDAFIAEMESYINFVVDGNAESDRATGDKVLAYDTPSYDTDKDGKVDKFSDFVYYEGEVSLTDDEKKPANHFVESNNAYKALSAVNELMFAYSTDTGCLNTYFGYAVSPYKTDFVSEFEYAAQKVVERGVGSYMVAPSDYGWHIIYCSYKFTGGEVYGAYDHAQATGENKVEGSFSNMFYESLKATSA